MGYLGRRSSDNMDYYYKKEASEWKNITMESMVSMVLTNATTDTHDLTKNTPHCVYPDNINPGMDYFLKQAHYDNYRKCVITYNGHYKVINHKDYNVKYLILKFSTQHMEHAHGGHNFVLSHRASIYLTKD